MMETRFGFKPSFFSLCLGKSDYQPINNEHGVVDWPDFCTSSYAMKGFLGRVTSSQVKFSSQG
jgi:hypothetical protein